MAEPIYWNERPYYAVDAYLDAVVDDWLDSATAQDLDESNCEIASGIAAAFVLEPVVGQADIALAVARFRQRVSLATIRHALRDYGFDWREDSIDGVVVSYRAHDAVRLVKGEPKRVTFEFDDGAWWCIVSGTMRARVYTAAEVRHILGTLRRLRA